MYKFYQPWKRQQKPTFWLWYHFCHAVLNGHWESVLWWALLIWPRPTHTHLIASRSVYHLSMAQSFVRPAHKLDSSLSPGSFNADAHTHTHTHALIALQLGGNSIITSVSLQHKRAEDVTANLCFACETRKMTSLLSFVHLLTELTMTAET